MLTIYAPWIVAAIVFWASLVTALVTLRAPKASGAVWLSVFTVAAALPTLGITYTVLAAAGIEITRVGLDWSAFITGIKISFAATLVLQVCAWSRERGAAFRWTQFSAVAHGLIATSTSAGLWQQLATSGG